MARWTQLFGASHDRTVGTLETVLAEQSWRVDREPVIASVRPDLVAHSPDGEVYVIEVKDGRVDANLGAVAQVEAFRNAVADASGEGDTYGVLVITGKPPENRSQLDAAANSADVKLVFAQSGDAAPMRASLASAGLVGDDTPQGESRTSTPGLNLS